MKKNILKNAMTGLLKTASVADCMEALLAAEKAIKRERSNTRYLKSALKSARATLEAKRNARRKPKVKLVPPAYAMCSRCEDEYQEVGDLCADCHRHTSNVLNGVCIK